MSIPGDVVRTGGRRGWLSRLCAVLFLFAVLPASAAYSPEVERGLAWLQAQVAADGALQSDGASVARTAQSSADVLHTLALLGSGSSALAQRVSTTSETGTEALAQATIGLVRSGRSASVFIGTLSGRQNKDGGFGDQAGTPSNPLDTAWALLAFRAAGFTNGAVLKPAVDYLVARSRADGGFATPGSEGAVYTTSHALLALVAYRDIYTLGTPVSRAVSWLRSERGSAASYGEPLYDAVASLALAAATTDSTQYSGLLAALQSAQGEDGSWAADPYLTSLALRALAGQALPPASATQGRVVGQASDAQTRTLLAGVTAGIAGKTFMTTASGRFDIDGIDPGTYPLSLSKAGYAAAQRQLTITAGAVVDVGNISLVILADAAVLRGIVSDGGNGQPLAAALVSITVAGDTRSVVTAGNGSFELTGIPPGSGSVSVSKAGYHGIAQGVTLESGGSYSFSPSLHAEAAPEPTLASVAGRVIAADSGDPISGAQVSAGGKSAVSGAGGSFRIEGLQPGAVSLRAEVAGYDPAGFDAVLSAGDNQVGDLRLATLASSLSLFGNVTNADDATPVAGAIVRVQGTPVQVVTNSQGAYRIEGLPETHAGLLVEAAGHYARTYAVNTPAFGSYRVDLQLERARDKGIALRAAAHQPDYEPYSDVQVSVVASNEDSSSRSVVFTATVYDLQRQAVGTAELRRVVAGQPVVSGAQVLPAGTHLDMVGRWYNQAIAPGEYLMAVTASAPGGEILAESTAGITINARTAVGGSLAVNPPIAQAGTSEPVTISAQVSNHGNQAYPGGSAALSITLEAQDPQPGLLPATLEDVLLGAPLNKPAGAVADAAGNLYLVNQQDRTVVRVSASGAATTVATLPVGQTPADITLLPDGSLRVISTAGSVIPIASDGTVQAAKATSLGSGSSITSDPQGNVYLAGGSSDVILRMDTAGAISTWIRGGLSTPRGIMKAADGLTYVSNANHTISRITSDGRVEPFLTGGILSPTGMLAESSGSFLLADSGNNRVVRVGMDKSITVVATGIFSPMGLVYDPAGNVIVSSNSGTPLYQISPSGQVSPMMPSLGSVAAALAYDGSGRLHAASSDGALRRVAADGSIELLLASGKLGSGVKRIAFGADGALYAVNGGSTVLRNEPGSQIVTTHASGLSNAQGIAGESSGSLLVADGSANRVVRLQPGGGTDVLGQSLIRNSVAVAIAPDGARYILNAGSLARIPASGRAGLLLSSLGGAGRDIALNPAGGVYILVDGTKLNSVSESGVVSTRATVPLSKRIAVAADGTVYLADNTANKIHRLRPDNSLETFSNTPFAVSDLSVDATGVLAALGDGFLYRFADNGIYTKGASVGTVSAVEGADDGFSYVLASGGALTRVSASGQKTILASHGNATQFARSADGQYDLLEPATSLLRQHDASNQQQRVVAGFDVLVDVESMGSEVALADFSRVYAMSPEDGVARLVASLRVSQLRYSGGNLHGAVMFSGRVVRFSATGATTDIVSDPSMVSLDSLAMYNGEIAVLGNEVKRVLVYGADHQVKASYSGVPNANGIAIDPAGRLHVASTKGVVRFSANGAQSELLPTPSAAVGVAIAGDGSAWVTNGIRIQRYDGSQFVTMATSPTGFGMSGLMINGGQVHASDTTQLYRLDGTSLSMVASTLTGTRSLRFAADGALYLAGDTGVLSRFAGGYLQALLGGLPAMSALAVSTETGVAYVAGGPAGGLSYAHRIDLATATATDQKLGKLVDRADLRGLAIGLNGQPLVVANAKSALYRLQPAVPVPVVAPGTEVYRSNVALAPMGVNGDQAVSLGQWMPPYAGDFRLSLVPSGSGQGEIVASLHVGPHAEASIVADRAQVAPGDVPLQLTVGVSGADFVSASRPDPGNLRQVSSLGRMVYIGSDPAGNIFLGDTSKIIKLTPAGVKTNFYVASGFTIVINGTLPVDGQSNLYVANSLRQILRIAPNGSAQVMATLPIDVRGMVLDSHDDLIVSTIGSDLYRIKQDGSYSRFGPAGNDEYYALTIDGKDNLYLLQARSSAVIKINTEGKASVVPTNGALFEYEDVGATIAGDCADNLFVSPWGWPSLGQPNQTEEYSLIQVSARGLASRIYDGTRDGGVLTDMDFLAYDRYGQRLLLWTDSGNYTLSSMPVTCGAISTDLHLVTAPGQTLSGFSVPPSAANGTPDGGTEYVWQFPDLGQRGKSTQFGTVLPSLALAEERPALAEAFLLFRNSFTGNDIKLPLDIPVVRVSGAIGMSLSTAAAAYPANSPVQIDLMLTNAGLERMTGELRLDLFDADGTRVLTVMDEIQSVEPGAPLLLNPPLDTGSYLAGSYQLKATFTDGDGRLQAQAEAGFQILASGSDPAGQGAIKVAPTVDKAAYGEYDLVQLLGRVTSQATNYSYEDVTLRLAVNDAQGTPVYEDSRAIAQLRPGAMVDLPGRYALPGGSIGTYGLKAEVLAKDGRVLASGNASFEVRRDNAARLTGSVVAAPRNPYLGDQQACTDTVRNGGSEALAALKLRRRIVELANDHLVAEEIITRDLAAGAQLALDRSFSTQGYNLGGHACVLEAEADGQWKTLGYDRFIIAKVPVVVSGTVAAAFKPVIQSDPQTCSAAVHNGGPRALQGLAVRQSVIRSASGQRVAETAGLLNLPAGGQQALPQTVDTSGYALGAYSCLLEAQVEGQWKILASDAFNVAPIPVKVSGTVVASSKPALQGETQTCKDTLRNDGAHALQDLPIRQRVIRVTPEQTLAESTGTQSLPAGGQQTLTRVFSIDDEFALGPHACVLEAQVDGQWKTLAYDNFTVDPPPLKLSGDLAIGDKGRLLVLMDGPANGSSGPLCNNGLFDLTVEADFNPPLEPDAVVEVKLLDRFGLLIDVESASLLSFNGEVNGRAGSRGIDLLIPSFSAGDLVIGLTGSTGQQVIDGTYQVVARVGTATRVLNLGTGVISLGCNTVHAVGDVLGQVFRVLGFNNHVHAGEGIGDGKDPVGAAAQRQLLETQLRGEGWSFKVVTSAADFSAELRSGAYQNYALLSEYVVLGEQQQKELREAINRGAGLLTAGRHDVRRRILDQPLGVQYSGTQLAPAGIEMLPASPLGSGQASFVSGNSVQRIKLAGAAKQGKLLSTVPSAQDSTVTLNGYGQGKSALGSFDLLGEASLSSDGSLFRQLIGKSLVQVNPPQANPRPGRTVPLQLHISNDGNSASVLAKVSASAGGYVVDASQGSISAGKLDWSFSLDAGATADNTLWLRLPPGGLPVTVSARLTASNGTQTVDAGTITLDLAPPLQPSLDDALAALTAYAATKPNPGLLGNLLGLLFDTRHPAKKALDHLKTANTALGQGDSARALRELVLTTDELIHDGSTQAAPIRQQVDEAIFETGQLQ